MRIKSRALSIAWKAILVVVGTYGLLDGSGILAGAYTPNFPHMFTNVANIFAVGYFVLAIIKLLASGDDGRPFAPVCKYTATISLLVTMLIAHFMLFNTLFDNGQLVLHLFAMHYVTPVMSILDWLLFDEKGKMPAWGPFAWLWLVLAYLVFTMVAVGVFGIYMGGGSTGDITNYPYTFLDPAISGVGGVAVFCGGMLVVFIVLGYVLFGIDRLLGRFVRREDPKPTGSHFA